MALLKSQVETDTVSFSGAYVRIRIPLPDFLTAGAPEVAVKSTSGLTAREQEILWLVADGLTTAQIADTLFTSPRTVETYRQNIMGKTGTKNTAALVKEAMSQVWLT